MESKLLSRDDGISCVRNAKIGDTVRQIYCILQDIDLSIIDLELNSKPILSYIHENLH